MKLYLYSENVSPLVPKVLYDIFRYYHEDFVVPSRKFGYKYERREIRWVTHSQSDVNEKENKRNEKEMNESFGSHRCAAKIAISSKITEMIKERSIEEAKETAL